MGKLFFLKELLKLYLAGGFYSFNVVKVAIVRFFRQSDSFLGENVRYMYYEAHV